MSLCKGICRYGGDNLIDIDLQKYCKNKNVKWRREKEGAILLDVANEKIYRLNVTAARVWVLCGTAQSISGICKILSHEFETDLDTLYTDIQECIQLFIRKELIIEKR